MKTTDKIPATPESVWEAFREAERLRRESEARLDREIAESRADSERRKKEWDEKFEQSNAKFAREFAESRTEFDRRMKKQEELAGSWGNNLGFFAEEYFFNSFKNGKQNFFGEKFDSIEKNVKDFDYIAKDEYDILLVNGKTVAIVEIKFKAHESDIPKVLRKAETFRINYPNYGNHRIFLGLATMAFYPELEEECKNKGIAIIKQIGDTVVVNDEHLREF
jgi:hypothetical protein